jgi:uncharacterized delta-60 repeat protein
MKTFSFARLLIAAGCLASCATPFGDAPGSGQTNGGTSSDGGDSNLDGGVLDPGVGFSFVQADGPAYVRQGQPIDITISVARYIIPGNDIKIDITGVPNGVSVDPLTLTIPSGSSTGHLTITVDPSIPQGELNVELQGLAAGATIPANTNIQLFVRGKPGTLDTSFGTDGIVDLGEDGADATGVATLPDGKIFLGGYIGSTVAVVRLTDRGIPDQTYGVDGRVRKSVGTLSSTNPTTNIVVDSSGAVVLGANVPPNPGGIALRVNPSGVIDTGFGDQGIAHLVSGATGSTKSSVQSLAQGSDGSLYFGAVNSSLSTQPNVEMKLLPDGTTGSKWANNGVQSISHSPGPECEGTNTIGKECAIISVALDPNDQLFVFQYKGDGGWLNQLDKNGQPLHSVSTTSVIEYARSLWADAKGNVLVAGEMGMADSLTILRFKLDPNLAEYVLDTDFGDPDDLDETNSGYGRFQVLPDSHLNSARGIAVMNDGTIIMGARATANGHGALGAVRLTSDGRLDTTFNQTGYVTTNIGTSEVAVEAMTVDSVGRILVVGGNGHMVAARYWQ